MQTLYPAIQPYATQRLAVDAVHELYVEECGNAEGLPVVYLHGGPGAGCDPLHRRFFDPEKYRIVLFDQRGCGRSTPHAELADNSTDHLIADIERIRQRLNVSRWVVFGGSWGSTLALAYAQTHPQHVLGLILRGIFLGRPRDVAWFYQDGASRLFPDLWAAFVEPIPAGERDDLVAAYYRRLTGDNELERMRAAKAWSAWEAGTLSMEMRKGGGDPHRALSLARIEAHYFMHRCFLQPDQLLRDAARLAAIPGTIVQGRYDVITPVDGAWALAQAWPQASLDIVSPAGHAASEPATAAALVNATRRLAAQLA